ncbi:PREDICTED: interleukin-3 receptor subunit alpha [Chinchilla lanigera]|uniref:interleukin-3 receptor subunit alpha n=1 Tax=Chinchilla lanigera TaxID=34839 RepID=UPI000697E531|nr:PREDICTED: interleukin-3 receptor subunit alpha [Chinchilla lanigera]
MLPLLLLLLPACCPWPAAQGPTAPIRNLRVEPSTGRLTWDLIGTPSGIECFKTSYSTQHPVLWGACCRGTQLTSSSVRHHLHRLSRPEALEGVTRTDEAEDNEFCEYSAMSLCTVTNYTVTVRQPPFSAWILFPEPDGRMEAAARNLSCKVHDTGPVLCSWAVGPGAPQDAQYQLSWKDLKLGQETGVCPHYTRDAQGRNVGCRFDAVSALPEHMMITVSGTHAARVPCADLTVDLKSIQTFSPPNITADCNRTHAHMSWPRPQSHFSYNFEYELRTQQIPGGVPVTEPVHGRWFQLPNPGTYTAQIRAKVRAKRWTAWSPPQTFGERCAPALRPKARGRPGPARRRACTPAPRGHRPQGLCACISVSPGARSPQAPDLGVTQAPDPPRGTPTRARAGGAAPGEAPLMSSVPSPPALGARPPRHAARCRSSPACDPDESSHTRAWRTAVLAALGALLLVLAVVVVCRRCGLLGRVFPRLPPMKDPLADAPQDGQLMPWEAGQEECPVSEVQLVSEK